MNQIETPAEDARLRTLRRYEVLDTPPEAAFDALTRAAAAACAAPMSTVSLVDAARQWFKSAVGLELTETPRSVSFCDHAMRGADILVVRDTHFDPRFRDNPLVTGPPHLRFYAGAAIRAPDGSPLGALCVLDTAPRPDGLTPAHAQVLRVLADQVEPQLRLRRIAMQAEARHAASREREDRLVTVLDGAEVGWWDWDISTDTLVGNAEFARTFGAEPDRLANGAPISVLFDDLPPQTRSALRPAFQDAAATGGPFREEMQLRGRDGEARWISARGRCLTDAEGRPVRFAGVAVDISASKRMEDRLREADMGREMALEAARLGRFDHDLVTGKRFYDARALQMLGITLEQAQDVDVVFARIHPEDRQRVIDAQLRVRDPDRRGPYREVYRVADAQGRERWISGVGRTVFRYGACVRFMGVLEDVTEAKRTEAHRALLVNELNHRVKNSLAVAQSLVDASLRGATDIQAARQDVARRIQALGRAHDLLTAQNWSAADVIEIVDGLLDDILPRARVDLDGCSVLLGPKPALQLSLALHELATNALKYGALSTPAGRVALAWRLEKVDGADVFTFGWTESGGPPVSPPTRRGFGSRLIERITAAEFSGFVDLAYAPEGVRWRLRAPYADLAERGRSTPITDLTPAAPLSGG